MKKAEYLKYVDPDDFRKLYEEWSAAGKPQGNDPLYLKIWNTTAESVKACIGALQARYHCQYQDYDEKVLDSTILIMTKLLKMEDTPKNIINLSYLPVLGVCCGPKARKQEWENSMLSTDAETTGGDTFESLLDSDGKLNY